MLWLNPSQNPLGGLSAVGRIQGRAMLSQGWHPILHGSATWANPQNQRFWGGTCGLRRIQGASRAATSYLPCVITNKTALSVETFIALESCCVCLAGASLCGG